MKKILSALGFCILTLSAFAQELPRVAVVPFNPVGVSERDASVITSLFETALVQTESFNVIEQNQIADIMEAQAYTMTGCTDESCAIEVGKLLAAEQIILGELSSIGGKFILNAKIIDVEQGRNIKADKVEATGMGEMTAAAELLAFKLAGLTYTSGGAVQVAQAFGEVLIETTPPGADIYVNGAKKGVSPDLITRIPLGAIRIEAKKGNLYAVQDITVTAETARISLTLEEQYGNLFIKSSEAAVDVYLDGTRLGTLGSGFFDKLPVGDHVLELRGQDVYWSGNITLEVGKSTKVDAYPRPFGLLVYRLPESSSAVITGVGLRKVLHGSGELSLGTGKYTIVVSGEIYENLETTVTIERGTAYPFSPEPVFTAEHARYLEEERRRGLYDELSLALEDAEKILSKDHRITSTDIDTLSGIEARITASPFPFPDLFSRCTALKAGAEERKILQDDLEGYLAQKVELETQISLLEGSRKKHSTGGWISLGAGSASAVLSVVSFIVSWSTYQDYLAAGEDEWQPLKDAYQTWDIIGYVSAGAAALGGGLTPLFWLTGPKNKDTAGPAARLAMVQSEINRLEEALE